MSHLLNLVEKQVSMSNVRDRLKETPSRPGQYVAEDGSIFGPCLLLSRECGSGGGLVARRVGELLGWNFFDDRIVDEIAQNANVHQRLVQSVDERVHSRWERIWREFLLDDLADEKYFRHLGQVVMALGHHGNVVIVGRGAQYFLPPQCAVRVRVVAPFASRIKRLSEERKICLAEARSQVEAIDKQRAAFIWKTFRKDIGSPLNTDITINTGEIEIESAVKIVMAVLREKLGVSLNTQPGICKEMTGHPALKMN
ncbi:MAG TPA: cytidylate kinase-like family protein [Verrucomicrobiae bacterium]|nr:cytidylate kinase-like family protein [Verrucomicrobiae bacterium]